MLSLLELVTQNQPHFQTHQALLVLGLQNDFIQPDGKLPVDTRNGFLDRIHALVPTFRKHSSNIIWTKTLYEADRLASDPNSGEGDAVVVGGLVDGAESSTDDDDDLAKDVLRPTQATSPTSKSRLRAFNILKRVSARKSTSASPREELQAVYDEDDELFLRQSAKNGPACLPGTPGAEFADSMKPKIDPSDTVVHTSNYSAFQGTSLLLILRARLVTEVYICGCITNVSVLATVIDAARHGIKINVVGDCLGFRKQSRHKLAIKRMIDFFDANIVTSQQVIARNSPAGPRPHSAHKDRDAIEDEKLQDLVNNMRVSDPRPTDQPYSASVSRGETPTPTINVEVSDTDEPPRSLNGRLRLRKPSDTSLAESRATTDTALSDEQFTYALVQGARVPRAERHSSERPQNLVKTKIRMRPRKPNEKIRDKEKDKETEKEKEREMKKEKEKLKEKAKEEEKERDREKDKQKEKDKEKAKEKAKAKDEEKVKAKEKEKAKVNESDKAKENTKGSNLLRESSKQNDKSDAKSEACSSHSLENESGKHTKADQEDRLVDRPRPAVITKAESSDRLQPAPSRDGRSLKLSASQPALSSTKPAKDRTSGLRSALSRAAKHDSSKLPVQPQPSPTKSASSVTTSETQNKTTTMPNSSKSSKFASLATLPVLGPNDRIAEGDSHIIYDFLPSNFHHPSDRSKPLKDLIFTQVYNEVRWQKMHHQDGEVPRLVCAQGEFSADGSMPIYRHPADQTVPLLHFSPKVQVIRKRAEKLVGHPLNHVLIQLYRSGSDYISEHSDKSLDIAKDSSIVNVSFGAQRTMRFRTKRSNKDDGSPEARQTQRVAMPHNSMFVLGLKSNQKWLHGIMPDKRAWAERSEAENAQGGLRISLTFRHIDTYLDAKCRTIWGQGATVKDQRDACDVINGDEEETERLVRAFSEENHCSDFEWDEWYGDGFDVLHFKSGPADLPILFASNNKVETDAIKIYLDERKIKYSLVEAPEVAECEFDRQVCFRDTDISRTEVSIPVLILSYLERYYSLDNDERSRPCTVNSYELEMLITALLKAWNNRQVPTYLQNFVDLLETFEERFAFSCGPFIAGRRFAQADCVAWPALDEFISRWDGWSEERFPKLTEYYRMLWRKKKSVQKLREKLPEIRKKSGQTTKPTDTNEEVGEED